MFWKEGCFPSNPGNTTGQVMQTYTAPLTLRQEDDLSSTLGRS